MKITYIHHSSFSAELERSVLLFDYFEGTIPEFSKAKTLYVLASHRHPDHFSKVIFELADKYPKIYFILSSDIWGKRIPDELKEKTMFLSPGEKKQIGELTVEAFKSTDEGVAFWCTAEGKEIYHAGDLNHWYWEGEEEQWNTEMTAAYRSEIKKMAGRTADIAFLPLDPRLEQWFYLGIDDYMKESDAEKIFPMHFWGQFDVTGKLKTLPCSESYRDKLVEISREGQEFEA